MRQKWNINIHSIWTTTGSSEKSEWATVKKVWKFKNRFSMQTENSFDTWRKIRRSNKSVKQGNRETEKVEEKSKSQQELTIFSHLANTKITSLFTSESFRFQSLRSTTINKNSFDHSKLLFNLFSKRTNRRKIYREIKLPNGKDYSIICGFHNFNLKKKITLSEKRN